MQDYIEVHLEEKIGLSELSEVSMFSPWYSYRLFQEYTGLTPSGYIRRLRLAKAAMRGMAAIRVFSWNPVAIADISNCGQ